MSRRRPDEVSEASAQATEALAVARRRLDQDDAEGARRFVEKALRLDPRHSEAGEFSAWLGKFGPGTKYDDAALAVLTATSHYAIFDLPKYQPVDATQLHKSFLKMSRLLHPDKSEAARAKEAFQLMNAAQQTLTDDVQKAKYDQKLRTGQIRQGGPPKRATTAASPAARAPAASPARRGRSPASQAAAPSPAAEAAMPSPASEVDENLIAQLLRKQPVPKLRELIAQLNAEKGTSMPDKGNKALLMSFLQGSFNALGFSELRRRLLPQEMAAEKAAEAEAQKAAAQAQVEAKAAAERAAAERAAAEKAAAERAAAEKAAAEAARAQAATAAVATANLTATAKVAAPAAVSPPRAASPSPERERHPGLLLPLPPEMLEPATRETVPELPPSPDPEEEAAKVREWRLTLGLPAEETDGTGAYPAPSIVYTYPDWPFEEGRARAKRPRDENDQGGEAANKSSRGEFIPGGKVSFGLRAPRQQRGPVGPLSSFSAALREADDEEVSQAGAHQSAAGKQTGAKRGKAKAKAAQEPPPAVASNEAQEARDREALAAAAASANAARCKAALALLEGAACTDLR